MTASKNSNPQRRPVRPWAAWPNWINIGLGLYLALSPLWIAIDRQSWFTIMGVLIIVAGLWGARTGSSALSQWAQIVLGILTFVSPWMVFLPPWVPEAASTPVTNWTLWIIGVLVFVIAIIGMARGRASTRV